MSFVLSSSNMKQPIPMATDAGALATKDAFTTFPLNIEGLHLQKIHV